MRERKGEETMVSFSIWNREEEREERHSLKRYVIEGPADGPHVVLNAGSHGDEFLAIDTAKKLYEEIQPSEVKGEISIVPEANIFAAIKNTRETPVPEFEIYEDEERNLNRCFDSVDPEGDEEGNITQRLAYHILKLVKDADYCFDMHTATSPGYKIDQIREKTDPDFSRRVRKEHDRLIRGSGLKYVLKTRSDFIGTGNLASVAPRHGVPTVTIEIGGGPYSETEMDKYRKVIKNLLREIGSLDGSSVQREQKIYGDLIKISSPAAGRYRKSKTPGDEVRKGEVIGRIESGDGSVDIVSQHDGIIESVHREEWVNEGTKLGHIAIREEGEGAGGILKNITRSVRSLLV